MTKLSVEKRSQILALLCEGSSMRAVSRVCGVSLNTVSKLLEDAGQASMEMHDDLVRNVQATRIQADEIWSFNYCKDRTLPCANSAPEDAGSVWTWTALDSDSKLIVSFYVGDPSGQSAIALMDDLRKRLANRVQLMTDGNHIYLEAVEGAFGGDIDYDMLVKIYGKSREGLETRYSPHECVGPKKMPFEGSPDPAEISASHVERSNHSLRMHMPRFARMTNDYSKKLQNHLYMVALYAVFYNFVRIHKIMRMTPAMAVGILDRLYTFEDLIARIDGKYPPKKRGPYKSKNSKVRRYP